MIENQQIQQFRNFLEVLSWLKYEINLMAHSGSNMWSNYKQKSHSKHKIRPVSHL